MLKFLSQFAVHGVDESDGVSEPVGGTVDSRVGVLESSMSDGSLVSMVGVLLGVFVGF